MKKKGKSPRSGPRRPFKSKHFPHPAPVLKAIKGGGYTPTGPHAYTAPLPRSAGVPFFRVILLWYGGDQIARIANRPYSL